MIRKLPLDAFSYYASLAPEKRSYQAVADHFSVSKRTVGKRALKEKWQDRLKEIEREARARTDEKLIESVEVMNGRHMKMFKAIQGRALEALKNYPLTSAMDAVRALDLSVKGERLIRGEPTDRSALDVGEIVRRECEAWLVDDDEETDGEAAGLAPLLRVPRLRAPRGARPRPRQHRRPPRRRLRHALGQDGLRRDGGPRRGDAAG
jgi:hypothetical protein